MVTLHDIMSTDLITVDPGDTLRTAAGVLADEGVGGVPVVSNGDLVGVITASDLIDFEATEPGAPTREETAPERTEIPDTTWEEQRLDTPPPEQWAERDVPAAEYFTRMWSDVGQDVLTRFESAQAPEWNVLDEHMVSEVMTRDVLTLPSSTDVQEAAEHMLDAEVHRVLVVDDGELVGLVSTTDFLRAVAAHGIVDLSQPTPEAG